MSARCGLLLLLCCQACFSSAASLQELLVSDQLRLRSWLSPATDIVTGQEVKLVIEVSTRRWFAGGTRIQHPEIHQVVVLQRDQFATNLSRSEGGQTWVVQQWSLELYPQRDGNYLIPALTLALAVNDAKAGIVRGNLHTEPREFSAATPELLRATERWLATPLLEIEQHFDRQLTGLQPGDAFTRTITSRATKVTAMMLPTPANIELSGLSAYADNPLLEDRSNRGEATAQRIDRTTYMVEQAGDYQLPEQIFYWWDTAGGQLQLAILPALTIEVAGDGTAAPSTDYQLHINIRLRWVLLAAILLLIGIAVRRRARQPAQYSDRQLLRAARRSLRAGDRQRATLLLYQWLNRKPSQRDWLSLRQAATSSADPLLAAQIDSLLATTYGETGAAPDNLRWQSFLPQQRRRWRRQSAELHLNPGSSAAAQKASG